MTIYLYKKTHSSGIQYLGKTTKDPFKYSGSGKVWKELLAEDSTHSTEILKICQNKQELYFWGKYYSELWNIVNSDKWANLVPETGGGGPVPRKKSEVEKKKISESLKGHIQSQETKDKRVKSRAGYKHSDETKAKICAAAKKRRYSPEARAKFKASYWKRRLDASG